VVDVQYSLDSGATWINTIYDNTTYLGNRTLDNALTVSLLGLNVDAAHGLSVRYLAGGGLFGTAGATTNTTNTNRLFPLNSFTLVPEPGAAVLGSLALFGLLRRRRN
jgi:hypothetical protein